MPTSRAGIVVPVVTTAEGAPRGISPSGGTQIRAPLYSAELLCHCHAASHPKFQRQCLPQLSHLACVGPSLSIGSRQTGQGGPSSAFLEAAGFRALV